MFITVMILPNVHSFLSPSQDEILLWERLIRFVTCQPQQSPYDQWVKPNYWIWIPVKILYHTFAAFTHIYSQVKLHTSSAEKYENYIELSKRWDRFRETAHEQKFQYCDRFELGKYDVMPYNTVYRIPKWSKWLYRGASHHSVTLGLRLIVST